MNLYAKLLIATSIALQALNCNANMFNDESVVIPNCIKRGGATLSIENATIILVDSGVGFDLKAQTELKKILEAVNPLDFINIIKYDNKSRSIALLGIVPSKKWAPSSKDKLNEYKVKEIQNCLKIADIEYSGHKLNASFKTLQSESSDEVTTTHTSILSDIFSNYIPRVNKKIDIYWFVSNPVLTDLQGNELNNDYPEELLSQQVIMPSSIMHKDNHITVHLMNKVPGYSNDLWNKGAWLEYFRKLNVSMETYSEQDK